MKPTPDSIPEALQNHLSTNSSADVPSLARYVDQGAALVTTEAIAALRGLHAPLEAKIAAVADSAVLRQRLELLTSYFMATSEAPTDASTQREVAFALLYFLKGFDRIPDSVPEVGLLDDAMIVQTVLQRHETVLEAHAMRQGRGQAGHR
jgi:uncharacterized membrane protein YkvA (DUF1232 family)